MDSRIHPFFSHKKCRSTGPSRWIHPIVTIRSTWCRDYVCSGKHSCLCCRWTTRWGWWIWWIFPESQQFFWQLPLLVTWLLPLLSFSIHVKNILRHCSHCRLCNYMGGSCLWWKFFACGCTLEEPSLSDMLQWMGSLDAAGWIWGVRWVSLPANQGLHRF